MKTMKTKMLIFVFLLGITDLFAQTLYVLTQEEIDILKNKISYGIVLYIVTDKQGNTLEITFGFRNNDPVMTKFDPDRLYQLEQNLKKVLKLNPSKADSSIRNMKYIQPIDYKDLK